MHEATRPLIDSGDVELDTGPNPYLFLVLQRDRPLAPSARYCLRDVDVLTLARGPARERRPSGRGRLEIAVDDPWMSTMHAHVVREGRGFVLEDAGSRNGTTRNGIAEARATLHDGDLIEVGRTFFLFRDTVNGYAPDVDESEIAPALRDMQTLSPTLDGELRRVARVARSTVSILVYGESGTGKEVLARSIHHASGRAGPFVAVNCAALSDGLVQSELFGHKRGAFSGAVEDRPGLFRSTDTGTLLLDEIGDLTPVGQGALLRVLQEGEVLPVGTSLPVHVDTRVVAATHRDLDALVDAGTFRRDLLARLSGFVFRMPPLRERREDLGMLLRALLRTLASDPASITLGLDATRALFAHDWPLNVRELEKCLGAAIAQCSGGSIQAAHLSEAVRAATRTPRSPADEEKVELSERDVDRRAQIVSLLRANGGNVSAVARAMGSARAQIHRWLRKYELDPAAFRRST
jgi:sigma-54 dependent transcriptional regulator, acetoin dehydrogenase operon transcriptional activator AcoR